jgi:hypothetical protein
MVDSEIDNNNNAKDGHEFVKLSRSAIQLRQLCKDIAERVE